MESFENIAVEVDDGRAEITLNRPDVLNALNGETLTELIEAIHGAYGVSEVYVLVLTGRGRGFSSGGDISEGYGDTSEGKFAYR